MARCEECIHGECCSVFIPVRTTLCNDNADEMCELFKPTADVVPKSEVEAMQRTYGEKLEVAEALIATLNKTKTEVAREIFAEIEKALSKITRPSYVTHIIAELKKKYTEEKHEN